MPDNKVIDAHYHVISPNLAKAIGAAIPIPDIFKRERMLTEEEQLEIAQKKGVDVLWFSFRTPPYYVGVKELPQSSPHVLTVARTANDYLAAVCQRYPGKYMAFADIPLAHGDAAIDEMKRALKDLGLHGICLQSNYDGKPLDAPEFRPFFEEANKLKTVVHVHPIAPRASDEALREYFMFMILGFPYDTSLAFIRMAYTGVLAQCPDVSFILSHAGGTIPYIWWRINMPYMGNRPPSHDHISAPPTEYLKQLYYDTALTDTDSLMLAYKRVGGNHLIFGTDVPYGLETGVEHTLNTVQSMDLPAEIKSGILGGNALALSRRVGT
ncbi:MAG: amidohydrolase family protein [Dehalococcoidales bacterium]|nr:amidohydrolase family protein [Dehalococcoidales bacterium]